LKHLGAYKAIGAYNIGHVAILHFSDLIMLILELNEHNRSIADSNIYRTLKQETLPIG